MHHLDPDFLPETTGVLARFILNPQGDIDGLLFENGALIHTAPHLSQRLAKALHIGERVSVAGVKPRGADVIVAVAITPQRGARILDDGPPKHPSDSDHAPSPKRSRAELSGNVRSLLYGPKGNVHGVLLGDGTIVRFPPHAAEAFAELLRPGAAIAVCGETVATKLGEIIDARALGVSPDSLTDIPKPHKPSKPKHPPGKESIHP